MYAPYTLAFQMSANSTALLSIDTFINVIFLGDIIINMMSAYQDNDFNIVTDHKVIDSKLKIILGYNQKVPSLLVYN
jgi:hypothetical protein